MDSEEVEDLIASTGSTGSASDGPAGCLAIVFMILAVATVVVGVAAYVRWLWVTLT